MKRNFDIPLVDISGIPIIEDKKPVILGKLIVNVLLATHRGEEDLSGEDKIKRYSLAERINEGGPRDFTIEEIALIKKLSAKALTVLCTAKIWKVCEDEYIESPSEVLAEDQGNATSQTQTTDSSL